MVQGEPLSVALYAEILNEREYDSVTIYDPHSDVVTALLDNVKVASNREFVRKAILEITAVDGNNINMWGKDNLVLVSPDAGANKKIISLAQSLDIQNIVKCDKTRDVKTGKLTGFRVYEEDLLGMDCLIVDDICDGGGTFIGLARELKKKNAGKLYLAVSHGIFSKGFDELDEVFDAIFTTDSRFTAEYDYAQNYLDSRKLQQFKMNTLL